MMTAKEAGAKSDSSYADSLQKHLGETADSIDLAAGDGQRSCSVTVPNVVLSAILEDLHSKGYTTGKLTESRANPFTLIPISW